MKDHLLCWLGFHRWKLRFLDWVRCDYIYNCARPGCEAQQAGKLRVKAKPNYHRDSRLRGNDKRGGK